MYLALIRIKFMLLTVNDRVNLIMGIPIFLLNKVISYIQDKNKWREY